MKHEWKKAEKQFYAPSTEPVFTTVPAFKFFTIEGKGNPNNDFFADYIGILYSLAYAVKMSPKQGSAPTGYYEYSIYPLEGVWDVNEQAKKENKGTLDKDSLVFKLMIRQPDFVTEQFAAEVLAKTKIKKPHPLLEKARFETIAEGKCVQMLHLGSYDNEPASFLKMEQFTTEHGANRKYKVHREIYLTDARKTSPEKLRTILRFQID